jgi:hypothetical protein
MFNKSNSCFIETENIDFNNFTKNNYYKNKADKKTEIIYLGNITYCKNKKLQKNNHEVCYPL